MSPHRAPGKVRRRDVLVALSGGVVGVVGRRAWASVEGASSFVVGQGAQQARIAVVAAANATSHVRESADYVCTGSRDETVLNEAVAACGDAGGLVILSPGTFQVSGAVLLRSEVAMQGAGRSTVLQASGRWPARDGSGTGGVVELATGTTHRTALRALTILGNKDHARCKGVFYVVRGYPIDAPGGADPVHLLDDVHVVKTASVGVHLTGGSHRSSYVSRVRVFAAGTRSDPAEGLLLDCCDSFVSECESGAASGDGIRIMGANNRLTGCKSWYSGRNGFYVDGVRNQLAACESQDNARHGFLVSAGPNTIVGAHADSNSRPEAGGLIGESDGFHLPFSEAVQLIGCQAYDRREGAHGSTQRYGFYVGEDSRDCQVLGVARHNVAGPTGGPGLSAPGMTIVVTGSG